jgi:hypothetical protein
VLRGQMNRVAGAGEPLDATTVDNIIRDLERIEEVNNVHHDLGNWAYCSSTRSWQKTQTASDAFSKPRQLERPAVSAAPATPHPAHDSAW